MGANKTSHNQYGAGGEGAASSDFFSQIPFLKQILPKRWLSHKFSFFSKSCQKDSVSLANRAKKMASAVAGSIAGSIGSSLLGFGASLLTSKGLLIYPCKQFDGE